MFLRGSGLTHPSFIVENNLIFYYFGWSLGGVSLSLLRIMELPHGYGSDRRQVRPSILSNQSQATSINPSKNFYEIHQEASKFYQAILMTTRWEKKRREEVITAEGTWTDLDEGVRHFQLGLAQQKELSLSKSL